MNDPMAVIQGRVKWAAVRGDSAATARSIPSDSIHAVIQDPPAWIGFMGKAWDATAEYLRFEAVMREALRVLRPGGHALVWAIPRTSHWTAAAIERAGFEIRDRIHDLAAADIGLANFMGSLSTPQRDALERIIDGQGSAILLHLFGSGFPKSLNVAKAIDKAAGIEPIGELPPSLGMATGPNADQWNDLKRQLIMPPPTTAEAVKWAGWGTALKPAAEHWILARKPFTGSVADNVIRYDTGAININGCRASSEGNKTFTTRAPDDRRVEYRTGTSAGAVPSEQGRWPAHLVLEHAPGCLQIGTREVKTGVTVMRNGGGGKIFGGSGRDGDGYEGQALPDRTYGDGRNEEIPAWECALGCPVRLLDVQAGVLKSGAWKAGMPGGSTGAFAGGAAVYGDRAPHPVEAREAEEGGASRFFAQFAGFTAWEQGFRYQAKAPVREKNRGCEHLVAKTAEEMTGRTAGSAGLVMAHTDGTAKANPYAGTSGAVPRHNHHPTVKSIALMRWLVRLITPPGGIVADFYMGSASTGVAALAEGCRFIGSEKDEDEDGKPLGYYEVAVARLSHAEPQLVLPRNGTEAALSL